MTICIAYFSRFGNNRACSEHLAQTLRSKGHTVESFSMKDVKPDGLPASDLYIFCSPTQAGNAPGKPRRFLGRFSPPEGASYAIVATYYGDPGTKTGQALSKILDGKGMNRASDAVSVTVTGLKGPLEEGYQRKLEEFAERLG